MSDSNYIGVFEDYRAEEIVVWERTPNGRKAIRYPNPYYFYVPSEEGSYTSMYGEKLTKVRFENREEFAAAKALYPRKFESDFSVLDKCLMDEYYGKPIPTIHCGMLDIEVDVDEEGFARPKDARLPINALTLYHQWTDAFFVLAVPPPGWEGELEIDPTEYGYDPVENLNVILLDSETELLALFLDLIEEVDFLTGWNSEFFDMPYLYQRILKLFGDRGIHQLCFNGANKPRVGEVERFGTQEMTVVLSGRNHLDYLAMFKKFTFEGRSSYALGNICEEELKITKLDHEGISLRELYLNHFKQFCTYNLIDVVLIKKLDLKFKFVALVNQMAHENTVPFEAILGTTRYVDSGTTNYAHHFLNVIVKDKDPVSDHGKVEGAIVMTPNRGLHEWVGSVDINSLYPSVLRSLNMSPETFIGQFETQETFDRVQLTEESQTLIDKARKVGYDLFQFFRAMSREYDWKGIYEKDNHLHTAKINGQYVEMTGAEWNAYLREKKWVVSGYGTIFDQSEKQGIVPAVLEYWYKERKALQKQEKYWKKEVKRLKELTVSA